MATSICTQASTLTSTILTSVSASVINTVAAARSSSEAVEAAAVAAAEEAINANATHSVRNQNLSSCYSFSKKKSARRYVAFANKARFLCFLFSLNSLSFSLTTETETNRKAKHFCKTSIFEC